MLFQLAFSVLYQQYLGVPLEWNLRTSSMVDNLIGWTSQLQRQVVLLVRYYKLYLYCYQYKNLKIIEKNNLKHLVRLLMVPLEIRQTNRELLHSRKTVCIICGEDEYCCLQMHHLKNKQYNISKAVQNLPTNIFKKELDKCICVCSNCHHKIHNNIIKL